MIALIEHEQGFPLYDAVGKLKRALSSSEHAEFHFAGGGIEIGADVRRADFERWIADELTRIEAAMDQVLVRAAVSRCDRPRLPDRRIVADPRDQIGRAHV